MDLWDTPAGFDQPIEALAACHRRIEKQLAILSRLPKHIERHGVDEEARKAVTAVMRYFLDAAPNHHADEEMDLFPMLLRAAEQSADRSRTFELISHLLVDHREMEAAWAALRILLEHLLSGSAEMLDKQVCKDFSRVYTSHINREESELFPLAARILKKPALDTLGAAMARRRGLPPPGLA
jgi:hemerythrin-like domain-containing protein